MALHQRPVRRAKWAFPLRVLMVPAAIRANHNASGFHRALPTSGLDGRVPYLPFLTKTVRGLLPASDSVITLAHELEPRMRFNWTNPISPESRLTTFSLAPSTKSSIILNPNLIVRAQPTSLCAERCVLPQNKNPTLPTHRTPWAAGTVGTLLKAYRGTSVMCENRTCQERSYKQSDLTNAFGLATI